MERAEPTPEAVAGARWYGGKPRAVAAVAELDRLALDAGALRVLDVAIEGNGFIAVNKREGEIAFTRAGSLKVDAAGRLVTSDGLAIHLQAWQVARDLFFEAKSILLDL